MLVACGRLLAAVFSCARVRARNWIRVGDVRGPSVFAGLLSGRSSIRGRVGYIRFAWRAVSGGD